MMFVGGKMAKLPFFGPLMLYNNMLGNIKFCSLLSFLFASFSHELP